ncbi:MAG: FGGY family carbohydrate kinase, partial [Leptolyngbyaceae bacterium]|nr:FGGY family carbohydrate kinase [Leptolyngbyaceae bacterium]
MNLHSYVIGVDIGTTSTKTVLFTEPGEIVCQHTYEYPSYIPTPSVTEQEPEDIWVAVTTSVKTVIATSQINPTQLL